jgi:hypothetical protein
MKHPRARLRKQRALIGGILSVLLLGAMLVAPLPAGAATAITVANLNDSGPGSLRQALVDIDPGGVIDFEVGLSGTIELQSELEITKALSIHGPGPDVITLSAIGAHRVIAVYDGTLLSAVDVEISGLTVTGGNGVASGGGIGNLENLTLRDMRIEGNDATSSGGGVSHAGPGSLEIYTSTITHNSSSGNGGGVHASLSTGALTVSGSTLSWNTAQNGGAIFTSISTTIYNTTFSSNSASQRGGAIRWAGFSDSLWVVHATFSGNGASSATTPGSSISRVALTQNANIRASVFANSSAGVHCSGSVTSQGSNVSDDMTCGGGANDATSNGSINLGALADNGGPTETHALLLGSSAIDSMTCGNIAEDQRDVSRPQGTLCDKGAYERRTPPAIFLHLDPPAPDGENGWYVSDVTVEWTIDPSDGITIDNGCVDQVINYDTAGVTLECQVTDSLQATTTFDPVVIKRDTTAPELQLPADISEPANQAGGRIVNYNVTATDNLDPNPTVECNPASGSLFGGGTTTVECTATDEAGNSSTGSFNVTITYEFGQWMAPLSETSTLRVKRNSMLMVGFRLGGGSAGLTGANATLWIAPVVGNQVGPEQPANPGPFSTGNTFRDQPLVPGQYMYTWNTMFLPIGVYQLRVDLGDGQVHTVRVQIVP